MLYRLAMTCDMDVECLYEVWLSMSSNERLLGRLEPYCNEFQKRCWSNYNLQVRARKKSRSKSSKRDCDLRVMLAAVDLNLDEGAKFGKDKTVSKEADQMVNAGPCHVDTKAFNKNV